MWNRWWDGIADDYPQSIWRKIQVKTERNTLRYWEKYIGKCETGDEMGGRTTRSSSSSLQSTVGLGQRPRKCRGKFLSHFKEINYRNTEMHKQVCKNLKSKLIEIQKKSGRDLDWANKRGSAAGNHLSFAQHLVSPRITPFPMPTKKKTSPMMYSCQILKPKYHNNVIF